MHFPILLPTALVMALAVSPALAQAPPAVPDKVVTPLKRQAPSASASAGAMERSLASGPRVAPAPVAVAPVATALASSGPAGPSPLTVVVTVTSIRALDNPAAFDPARVQARVAIAGVVQDVTRTGPAATWVARKSVGGGKIAIRLDLFDGPPGDRPIDFNRAADRRHHDFIVDTAACRVLGFSGTPACGEPIVRSGTKARRAEVTLTVAVTR
jgi:hypothetical protein